MDTNNDEQPLEFNGIDEALDFMSKQESDSADTITEDEEPLNEDTEETVEEDDESQDSEEEQPEDEEESDAEDQDEEDQEEEEYLFKIEDDDGEFIVKDAEEAKKGYLRQKQFTKVTQEIAKERQEIQEEKSGLLEAKAQYVQTIAEYKAAASDKLGKFVGVDWTALQKDDPIEFDELKSEFEAAKLAYEQSNLEEQKASAELTAETMELAQQVRKDELAKLTAVIPELAEEGNTLLADIKAFALENYGFSNTDVDSIYDHRQIRVLADALELKKMKEKVQVGKAKAKSVKKSIKPKSAASQAAQKTKQAKARKAKLNQPGGISLNEALDYF